MATQTGTPGQRMANRVDLWLKDNDRTVAWLARQIGASPTTLGYQIKVGKFPIETALLIADVLTSSVEELAA